MTGIHVLFMPNDRNEYATYSKTRLIVSKENLTNVEDIYKVAVDRKYSIPSGNVSPNVCDLTIVLSII